MDLDKRWDQLKLTKEKNARIELGTEHMGKVTVERERSLVGKLYSDHKMSKDVIRSTMAMIQRLGGSFVFQGINPNLFVLTFENQEDKRRVLDRKPWLFDKHLLVMKYFDGFTPPQKMNFDNEDFWVQMNKLPLACMT